MLQSDRLLFAFGAIFCVALFFLGLRTGKMPMKVGSIDRAKMPNMFKVAGAMLLGTAACFAFAAVAA